MNSHRPTFKVEANGKDISAILADRLQSLTITDEAGIKSDAVTIKLADDGIKLPAPGAELRVWLGYESAARFMGLYVVDEVELSGPPSEMTIKATAAPLEGAAQYQALQDQKSRSWEPQAVGDLVAAVAADHGLTPAVAAALSVVQLDHLDQTNESDMHLLTRVAADLGAIAKAGGGRLLFIERAAGRTASGASMPTVALTAADLMTWTVRIASRSKYRRVVAVWRDTSAAVDVEAVSGEGEPTFRIRHPYPSQAAATAAARARLDAFTRGEATLSATLPGRADLVAESRAVLSGIRSGVNGEWSVTRVTHSLTSKGFTTALDAEVPKV